MSTQAFKEIYYPNQTNTLSWEYFLMSLTMKIRSNLERIVVCKSMLSCAVCKPKNKKKNLRILQTRLGKTIILTKKSTRCQTLRSSYRPEGGLAAARTEVLEFRTVVIPAFAMEMVCCSIASWIATLYAWKNLLSNSIHQEELDSLYPMILIWITYLPVSSCQIHQYTQRLHQPKP